MSRRLVKLPFKTDLPEKLEPSGICFSEHSGSLFVVGDEGRLAEVDRQGELLQWKMIEEGADFEGITVGPGGVLYAINEKTRYAYLIEPRSWRIVSKQKISRKYTIDGEEYKFPKDSRHGYEGITYQPTSDRFFLTKQSKKTKKGAAESFVYEARLPEFDPGVSDEAPKGKIVNRYPFDLEDLSDIYWDRWQSEFLLVSAKKETLLVLDEQLRIKKRYEIPGGGDVEGVCRDDQGIIYFALDNERCLSAWKLSDQ